MAARIRARRRLSGRACPLDATEVGLAGFYLLFGPASRAPTAATRAAATFQGIDASLSWVLTVKSPRKFDAACQRARRLQEHRRELGIT